TNNTEGWKMIFITISVDKQDDLFSYDCDVTIYYEREPEDPDKKLKSAGDTLYFPGGLAEIRIYYLDIEYDYREETRNGNKIFVPQPIQYANSLRPEIPITIRHEIGHALGLGHFPVTISDFKLSPENKLFSPSIMIEDPPQSKQRLYQITPYDVRAVVSLYGEKGFSTPEYLVFVDYLIIVIPIGILSFIIYKKWKKKIQDDMNKRP
ncbi:MAG: hypothetical protein ACRD9Q_01410, partial [Nitrososphaeraceae archaeon]